MWISIILSFLKGQRSPVDISPIFLISRENSRARCKLQLVVVRSTFYRVPFRRDHEFLNLQQSSLEDMVKDHPK